MVSRTATWRFEYDGIFSILVEYNTYLIIRKGGGRDGYDGAEL